MKLPLVLTIGALLCSCAPSGITAAQANQLILTALERDDQWAKKDGEKVCVRREFDPPLLLTRQNWRSKNKQPEDWREYRSSKRLDPVSAAKLDAALSKALTTQAAIAPITQIAAVPSPLILFTERTADRRGCKTETSTLSIISLTRPVIADHFAFVEHAIGCGPTCGAGGLDVFERKGMAWVPVASGGFWQA